MRLAWHAKCLHCQCGASIHSSSVKFLVNKSNLRRRAGPRTRSQTAVQQALLHNTIRKPHNTTQPQRQLSCDCYPTTNCTKRSTSWQWVRMTAQSGAPLEPMSTQFLLKACRVLLNHCVGRTQLALCLTMIHEGSLSACALIKLKMSYHVALCLSNESWCYLHNRCQIECEQWK